jgi:nucleoside-diphosphate-sugar epimerase
MSSCVIFGGTGFIGCFFALHLINEQGFSKVYLYDKEDIQDKNSEFRKKMIVGNSKIAVIKGDVEQSINWRPAEDVELIANFAAVHREPGHEAHEYYKCNILGAENVCDWAERVCCNRIIFSSSIAPYGSSEAIRDERSIPVPESAYGGSKLVAEKINQVWHARNKKRQLVIVRPGVVFGPGEGGNVSRLVKAVMSRYFMYTGNKQTRKAGTYVKELCRAMTWVLSSRKAVTDGVTVFNMSMNPGPSIQEYVEAIARVAKIKTWIPSVPSAVLLVAAYMIEVVARPFGLEHPFSPVRIKKLVRSNNILPSYLVEQGYEYKYSLDDALIDWKKDCPEEWQ